MEDLSDLILEIEGGDPRTIYYCRKICCCNTEFICKLLEGAPVVPILFVVVFGGKLKKEMEIVAHGNIIAQRWSTFCYYIPQGGISKIFYMICPQVLQEVYFLRVGLFKSARFCFFVALGGQALSGCGDDIWESVVRAGGCADKNATACHEMFT